VKKTFRQGQILNLIRSQTVRTQEELAASLKKLGTDVTQVTLSRDIHELGLVKTAHGYAESQAQDTAAQAEEDGLKWTLEEFVRDVKVACNLVIIKTAPGNAQTVAVALDREGWPEILGTIAGDDTVFAATPDGKQAAKIRGKLLGLLK
jgi:transcriptional regulator of arginine metabolism